NTLLTSPDGINWTTQIAPPAFFSVVSVTFGNGLFVATGSDPVNNTDVFMTSPDGINWTLRPQTVGSEQFVSFRSIAYVGGRLESNDKCLGKATVDLLLTTDMLTSLAGIGWSVRVGVDGGQD